MDRTERQELHRRMLRLADGDREVFEPIYHALWPVLLRFAERALAGTADAEDAAQRALIRVFERSCELDPDRDALSWVLGIAAYECKTLRQSTRRRREAPDVDLSALAAAVHTPEEAAVARDLEAAALELLGSLRPADVETLRLVSMGKRPDVTAATFRKRVERAMARLRAAWRAKHGTE